MDVRAPDSAGVRDAARLQLHLPGDHRAPQPSRGHRDDGPDVGLHVDRHPDPLAALLDVHRRYLRQHEATPIPRRPENRPEQRGLL